MSGFDQPIWDEGLERKPLSEPLQTEIAHDLLIVGGGFLGLSAALHAARMGLSVQVLEAGRVGEQASGMNGGQVIPGLKYDPEWLLRRFGETRGEALVRFAAGTADEVFDLIQTEGLDVPHRRSGWIQACHTQKALATATERHRQWKAAGADVAMLDEQAIRSAVGTGNYLGGFLDRRAGTINPLAFVLELARLATEAGAAIAENARCAAIRRENGLWEARLHTGERVRGRKVLVAANAYSDGLIPGLAETLIALHSLQVATARLDPRQDAEILPGGQAVSDSRRILVYYRKTATGRLILGGRGPMRMPRFAGDWAHLERALRRLFPTLAGLPIERRWFGRVAVTPDHLPHIHEPEPGLLTMVGCQGRGVGLMTASGPRLVDYLMRGDRDSLPLPLSPITPIPLHQFRRVGVAGMIAWYRMLDALER